MKKFSSFASLIVFAAFPFASVQACGPDFSPDVFVHRIHPDHPREYAAGKLGVLLSSYPEIDLMVAYRYLNGGTLDAEEQKGYHPTLSYSEQERAEDEAYSAQVQPAPGGGQYDEPAGPADLWLKARGRYAPGQPEIHDVREYDVVYRAGYFLAGSYENCQADAFRTAIATLENRAKTWGTRSAELTDWIKGQDAVFSNCGGPLSDYGPAKKPVIQPSSPAPAPNNAPPLLRQDRAYQIAAAQFYAAQFDAARASFEAISQDAESPWRGIARYLVARCLVRQSFLTTKPATDGRDPSATFDPNVMKQAQQQLETMRNDHLPGVSRQAVNNLLNLVRIRIEPKARARELSAALAGPGTDPDYAQDLIDLGWYIGESDPNATQPGCQEQARDSGGRVDAEKMKICDEKEFQEDAELRSVSPLLNWLDTVEMDADSSTAHALAEWKRTGSMPWLVAAIMKASSNDAAAPALIEAAVHVPPTSPGWLTIEYHRLRLLIDSGHAAEARRELTAAFPRVQATGSGSAVNLFTGLRMRTAVSLDQALADAPRKILERTSEEQSSLDECLDVMKDPKRKYDCKKDDSPVEFSADAATMLNSETPLASLAVAAQSDALSPQLRQSMAMMTWVRAVLLKNRPIAARVLPLLPEKLQQQAGAGVGFRPLMAILRNPGLRPYLDNGVQRSDSYDFVESYGDNWWCANWTTIYGEDSEPVHAESVAFLPPRERANGEQETKSLLALGGANEYLGSQIIAYAKANPYDPDVPEALYLTLRMIRYGCSREWEWQDPNKPQVDPMAAIAYEIGTIMRRRYPTNPWTKRAAPYVWLGKRSG